MSIENKTDSIDIKPPPIVEVKQWKVLVQTTLFALITAMVCLAVTTAIVDTIALTGPHDDWQAPPMYICHVVSFAGWISCTLGVFFMPRRMLQNGCMSFAAGQLLTYQLLTMILSKTAIYAQGFAMPLVRNPIASAALLISCFIFSCRARYLHHKFTSAFDLTGFVILVVAFYAEVSIFHNLLPFGDGFK